MAVEDTYRFDRSFTLDIVMIHFNPLPSFTLYLFSCLLILPFHIGHRLCLGLQSRVCFEVFFVASFICSLLLPCVPLVCISSCRALLGERTDINMKRLLFSFYVFFSLPCFQNVLNSYSFLKSRNGDWNSRSSVVLTVCWMLYGVYLVTYILTYLRTYSMEQIPSWEANWFCS
jgi:hypothetical protein